MGAFLWLPVVAVLVGWLLGWHPVVTAIGALSAVPSSALIALWVVSYRRDRWFDRTFEPTTTIDPAEAGEDGDR